MKSPMTCYMAAKRRWITGSEQMLSPHKGPSEYSVIHKDQLKLITKCRLTHSQYIVWSYANMDKLMVYTVSEYGHTDPATEAQRDFADRRTAHLLKLCLFYCIFFLILRVTIAGMAAGREDLSIKPGERALLCLF